jgi:hypothetical protein
MNYYIRPVKLLIILIIMESIILNQTESDIS